MFKKPSNYFLSISFDWKDILNILEVSEEEQSDFVINEKYYYQSPNANIIANSNRNPGWFGVIETSTLFEYYIMPESLRNGSGKGDSCIYDQQLKRFFESPNINY